MIPTLLLPFNAIKAVLNAALTLCLYKPISKVLKKSGFGKPEEAQEIGEDKKKLFVRSLLVWIIGGAIALTSLLLIFLVLGGKIAFN